MFELYRESLSVSKLSVNDTTTLVTLPIPAYTMTIFSDLKPTFRTSHTSKLTQKHTEPGDLFHSYKCTSVNHRLSPIVSFFIKLSLEQTRYDDDESSETRNYGRQTFTRCLM